MLIRLVQLEIKPGEVERFISLFAAHKTTIQGQNGCISLDLLQNREHPEQVATLSRWATQEDLDHYRYSAFFKELWTTVKPLFSAKAKAISYNIAG